MTREQLNKEIRMHQEYAVQLLQLLEAVDSEPREQRESLLKDISFLTLSGEEMSIYLKNKQSRWPRLLAGVFGEGTKSVSDDGLNVFFKKAPLPLTVRGYLSPNCRIVVEEYEVEEPVMVESGETETRTRTRRKVVCD